MVTRPNVNISTAEAIGRLLPVYFAALVAKKREQWFPLTHCKRR